MRNKKRKLLGFSRHDGTRIGRKNGDTDTCYCFGADMVMLIGANIGIINSSNQSSSERERLILVVKEYMNMMMSRALFSRDEEEGEEEA